MTKEAHPRFNRELSQLPVNLVHSTAPIPDPAELVPSGGIIQLSAFDPKTLVLALQDGFLEHVQLQKGRFLGQIAQSQSSQCRTDWGQYNLAILAQGDLSAQWLTVGIFLHGDGHWHVQGQPLRNGDLVLYSEGSEMCISLPPHAQWLGVQIPRQRLEHLGFNMPHGMNTLHLPGQLPHDAAFTLAGLANVLGPRRLKGPCAALSDQAHEQLLQVIWTELARRWHQPRTSAVASQKSRQRLVQTVHKWCEDRSATPLRMDALCQEIGVPIWQLERAFQQTYGMPPQRLLTLHRLAKTRLDLLTRTNGVTQIAMAHGFWHLGRFSVLYKDYFGESPSDTARAKRQAAS